MPAINYAHGRIWKRYEERTLTLVDICGSAGRTQQQDHIAVLHHQPWPEIIDVFLHVMNLIFPASPVLKYRTEGPQLAFDVGDSRA